MKLSDLSAGWRTDFIAHGFDATVRECNDCVAVHTPTQPSYYWGNALVLPTVPADADLAHWLGRFEAEVASRHADIAHVAIGINHAPPAQADTLPAWRAAGFDLRESVTLRCTPADLRALERAARGEIVFRPAELPQAAQDFVDLQCADPGDFEPAGYRRHRERQMARMGALAAAGIGQWFGVWCDGVLAADCGLLRDGTLGRFQHVGTHPAWRRRGLCATLVHRVAQWGFQEWGLAHLYMCADPSDVAVGIYESLGFQRFERTWCLERRAAVDKRQPLPPQE